MQNNQTKKKRFYYYEDADVYEYINKQPFHLKSDFVRKATRALMKKELKK